MLFHKNFEWLEWSTDYYTKVIDYILPSTQGMHVSVIPIIDNFCPTDLSDNIVLLKLLFSYLALIWYMSNFFYPMHEKSLK